MAGRRRSEGNVVRVAGAVTAVAGAVTALIALAPHDPAPIVSSTIQNVISVPASGPSTVERASPHAPPQTRTAATTTAASAIADPHESAASTPPAAGTDEWSGGSSYTAILASKATEAQARAIQRTASERGLDAGVLFSSHFRSLRPNYWVVFSGAFASVNSASTHAQRVRALGFVDAYPRYVSP